ncbi:MAG: DUF3597 domain-containing protein [Janthinobacterium lividum]
MSLFNTILEKLGISTHANASAPATPAATPEATSDSSIPSPSPSATQMTPAPVTPVDVTGKLDSLASQNAEKLNWKTSIVDLLKLLEIDSSLANRKELAKELHYSGSTDDSAAMNVWLHKAVLTKLSENGGQVPADLLD